MRLNVGGRGYGLYSGEDGRFCEGSLDVATDDVVEQYLKTQERLDSFLGVKPERCWALAARRVAASKHTVVAYGCWLNAADEFGRRGLYFVHCCVLTKKCTVLDAVRALLVMLAPESIAKLVNGVQGVAQEGRRADEFLLKWSSTWEDLMKEVPVVRASKRISVPLRSIRHDCIGGMAAAWLFAARQQSKARDQWEIYDAWDGKGVARTVIEPSLGVEIGASELLSSALWVVEVGREAPVADLIAAGSEGADAAKVPEHLIEEGQDEQRRGDELPAEAVDDAEGPPVEVGEKRPSELGPSGADYAPQQWRILETVRVGMAAAWKHLGRRGESAESEDETDRLGRRLADLEERFPEDRIREALSELDAVWTVTQQLSMLQEWRQEVEKLGGELPNGLERWRSGLLHAADRYLMQAKRMSRRLGRPTRRKRGVPEGAGLHGREVAEAYQRFLSEARRMSTEGEGKPVEGGGLDGPLGGSAP